MKLASRAVNGACYEHGVPRLAAALLLCLTGCAGSAAVVAPPSTVLDAYVAALRASDAERAHAQLSPELRSSLDVARLRALLAENPRETAEQADALARQSAAGVPARARVPLRGGEAIGLVLEDGEWRIEGGFLDAALLGSPEDAVASLRRALQRRSLPGVLRLLSRDRRADVDSEIAAILAATEDPDALDIQLEGDAATVHLPGGAVIELVREAGEWRVTNVR